MPRGRVPSLTVVFTAPEAESMMLRSPENSLVRKLSVIRLHADVSASEQVRAAYLGTEPVGEQPRMAR